MDLFRLKSNDKATSYDFYDTNVKQNTKLRNKEKRMLHKISRSRIKQLTRKEMINKSEE